MYKFKIIFQTIKRGIGVKYLKATGVTRKIDELGRIVIPKEIRRNLSIRDGENLEIFIDEDAILLKKYNQMHNFLELGNKLINIITSLVDVEVILTDREKIVASSTKYQELINTKINQKLINLIDERETYISETSETMQLETKTIEGFLTMVPIVSSLDSLGLVIVISNKKSDNKLLTKLIAKILADKVDIY